MRHSLEPEYRKYVKGYGFLSFARNVSDKYGKKLVDTATSNGGNTRNIHSTRKEKQIIKDLKLF